jgi:hypothetical protein
MILQYLFFLGIERFIVEKDLMSLVINTTSPASH